MAGIRAQRRQATRMRIMASARNLFKESMYDEVGVRDIAQGAGVAAGTVISVFGSKAGLLTQLVIEDFETIIQLAKAAANNHEYLYDRITAMAGEAIDYQFKQLGLLRAMLADSWLRAADAENQTREAVIVVLKTLANEVEIGQARGDVRANIDSKQAALLMIEVLFGAFRLAIYGNQSAEELKAVIGSRAQIILGGLLVPR